MTKRKDIFQVKKNKFGNPIILARIILPFPMEIKNEYFNEIHLLATLQGIEIAFRNGNKCLETRGYWKNIGYFRNIETEFSLRNIVNDIINSFKQNKFPEDLPAPQPTAFGLFI